MKKTLFFLLAMSAQIAFAGTIRLYNNTYTQLSVVIESFDGSFLDEFIVNAQDSFGWTDSYDNPTDFRGTSKPLQQSSISRTPYTVSWYCTGGQQEPYSVCTNVAEGSLVTPNGCSGQKECPLPTLPNSGAPK